MTPMTNHDGHDGHDAGRTPPATPHGVGRKPAGAAPTSRRAGVRPDAAATPAGSIEAAPPPVTECTEWSAPNTHTGTGTSTSTSTDTDASANPSGRATRPRPPGGRAAHEGLGIMARAACAPGDVRRPDTRPSLSRRLGRGGALLRAEALSTVRDTSGILVANAVQPYADQPIGVGDMTALEAALVPLVATMAASMVAVVNMPSFIATYRRTGILRTLAVTPVSPAAVLAANVVVSLAQLLLGVAVTVAVAAAVFGLQPPADGWSLALSLAAGLVGMYGVGAIVAAIAPTPNASVAIGLVAFLGFGVLGGMFGPTTAYPEWLRTLGEVLPFGAMVDVVGDAWIGQPLGAAPLIGLAVTGVVGTIVGFSVTARR